MTDSFANKQPLREAAATNPKLLLHCPMSRTTKKAALNRFSFAKPAFAPPRSESGASDAAESKNLFSLANNSNDAASSAKESSRAAARSSQNPFGRSLPFEPASAKVTTVVQTANLPKTRAVANIWAQKLLRNRAYTQRTCSQTASHCIRAPRSLPTLAFTLLRGQEPLLLAYSHRNVSSQRKLALQSKRDHKCAASQTLRPSRLNMQAFTTISSHAGKPAGGENTSLKGAASVESPVKRVREKSDTAATDATKRARLENAPSPIAPVGQLRPTQDSTNKAAEGVSKDVDGLDTVNAILNAHKKQYMALEMQNQILSREVNDLKGALAKKDMYMDALKSKTRELVGRAQKAMSGAAKVTEAWAETRGRMEELTRACRVQVKDVATMREDFREAYESSSAHCLAS
ncbi:hypothetical protein U1Q18_051460 [Sarracenia purpurea var. burkii]